MQRAQSIERFSYIFTMLLALCSSLDASSFMLDISIKIYLNTVIFLLTTDIFSIIIWTL